MQETVGLSKYGNLDKEQEYELPKGFKRDSDYYVLTWRVQTLEDNSIVKVPSSFNPQVFTEDDFDLMFEGYKKGSKTLFEKVTGCGYAILHNPSK